jgi:hypothetical protein
MTKCINDPKSICDPKHPSPKGLGYRASFEDVGTKMKGRDGNMWIVVLVSGKIKRWKLYDQTKKNSLKTKKNTKEKLESGSCKNFVLFLTKQRKLIAGLKTRPGYFRPWISYNYFSPKEVKIRKTYKLYNKHPRQMKREYCGDKQIINKSTIKIKHIGKKYFIQDNTHIPFLVCINRARNNEIMIYKMKKDTYKPDDFRDRYSTKYSYLYSEEVYKIKKPTKIFIGKSLKNEITFSSDTYGKRYDGNTILVEIGTNEYIFIGKRIYYFKAKTEIVEFNAPITHNEVAMPYAIDQTGNYYLFVENVIVKYPSSKLLGKVEPYSVYYKKKRGKELQIESISGKKMIHDKI